MDYGTDYLNNLVSQEEAPQEQEVQEVVEEVSEVENVVEENIVEENINNTPEASVEEVKETIEPKRAVNEKIAELNDFLNRNPEKTETDFFELKKPLSEIPEDELIRKYLAEKEGLTPSELKLKMKEIESANQDDEFGNDFLDEDDVDYLRAKAEKERLLLKAQDYHTEKVDGFFKTAVSENETTEDTQVHTEEEIRKFQQQLRQDYDAQIMQSANELEGVEFEVNGEKIKVIPTDNERKALMETGYKVNEIVPKYFSQDGLKLEKATEFAKDVTFWLTPETRNSALKSAYEQGVEAGKMSQMRSQRNINNSGKVEVEGVDGGREKVLDQLYASSRMVRQ